MYKQTGNPPAGSGWLWAEFSPGGSVAYVGVRRTWFHGLPDAFDARSSRSGLKLHAQRVGIGDREVELFKPDDAPSAVFHEHDFVARFLADVFLQPAS
jgi:hypothetical protein